MNTLLISFGAGAFALVLIFSLCFLAVHIVKLIKLGWQTQYPAEQANEPKKEDEPKPKESEPQPVYYIVERKRRAKTTFSEPKRIDFK